MQKFIFRFDYFSGKANYDNYHFNDKIATTKCQKRLKLPENITFTIIQWLQPIISLKNKRDRSKFSVKIISQESNLNF